MWIQKMGPIKHFMKAATVLLFLLASISIEAQQMLQYNLKVNDKFKVEQHAKQHIIQDINGTDQIIDNHLKSVMEFKVVEVTKDLITFEMSFQHLKMTMSSPSLGELLNADTNLNKEGDITSQMFKGTLNIPVTIIMEKTGKIKSVTGGDQLIASMFKLANITDAETIATNTPHFEKQFGSTALSNSFEQMTYVLPNKPVQVQEHWENAYQGDLKVRNHWTLSAYNSENYSITGKADATMSNVDENVEMVLNGHQNTSIEGNSITGLFHNITVEGVYTGDTQIHAENLSIPTQITSNITYKIFN